MLWKGVNPYEYWEKFNETVPEKEDFYNHLSMEDIDADHVHRKILCKDFEIKNSGEYQSNCC